MNGLKEVSRLIEETESSRSKQGISQDEVMDWMSSNKVLSVVLEGNIDQVQYTDRIKAIVEFLGPKLSPEELTNIWNLGEVNRENLQSGVPICFCYRVRMSRTMCSASSRPQPASSAQTSVSY